MFRFLLLCLVGSVLSFCFVGLVFYAIDKTMEQRTQGHYEFDEEQNTYHWVEDGV
jgi:hypothetical protein